MLSYLLSNNTIPVPVLVKNVLTGNITTYPKAIDFLNDSELTRKEVYGTLKRSSQKRYGNIIFKYVDDNTPWKQ